MSTYWISHMGMEAFEPPPALPLATDVAVVGGGLMGVATAYWLAREGKSVLLLEQKRICAGATGRNAGLMLHNTSPLESPTLLRQVLTREGINAGYANPGHLALAGSQQCWDSFQEEAERSRRRNGELEALDLKSCEELLGLRLGNLFLGGRWFPQGGVVHSARLVMGLARAAERNGAIIAAHTPVREIRERKRDRLQIVTSRGTVEASHVVVACSFRTASLLPELDSVLRPSVAQVLSTAPLPALFKIGLGVDWGSMYWRQVEDGSIVIGGGGESFDPETDPDDAVDPRIQGRLEGFLGRAFPDVPAITVRRRWAGIMDSTPDGRPLVGPLDTEARRWVVAGFGGHGMPAAIAVGREVAQSIVTGQDSEALAAWTPTRFEQKPSKTSKTSKTKQLITEGISR